MGSVSTDMHAMMGNRAQEVIVRLHAMLGYGARSVRWVVKRRDEGWEHQGIKDGVGVSSPDWNE